MSRARMTMDPDNPRGLPGGRVDHEVLDATSEDDIARQARDDDAEAMHDTGASPAGCGGVSRSPT